MKALNAQAATDETRICTDSEKTLNRRERKARRSEDAKPETGALAAAAGCAATGENNSFSLP
jgi:hypothetical protein